MLSKPVFVLLMCIMLLFITGCVDVDIELTIHKDGSGEIMYRMAMDPLLYRFLTESDSDPLEDFIKEAEVEGFLVTVFRGETTGLEARKVIENMGEGSGLYLLNDEFDMDQLVVNKGLFKNQIIFDTELDLTVLEREFAGDFEQLLGKRMLQNMRFDFTLNLPVKPAKHNASTTENDGRTLIWNLTPGDKNPIYMEIEVLNIQNILILAGVFILSVIVIVVVLKTRKPEK